MRNILRSMLATTLVAVLAVACGKKEEEAPPVVTPVAPKQATQTTQSTRPAATVATTKPAKQGNDIQPLVQHDADDAPNVSALEASYVAKPEFTDRVQIIYKLSDAGTPDAIYALGRLFHAEKDPDLKVEIMDSLFDIDGQDDKKVALLAAGAGPDQPKDVRESAIDGLGDVDAQYALPILKPLANDPDEEIREQAKDAIEQFATEDAPQK